MDNGKGSVPFYTEVLHKAEVNKSTIFNITGHLGGRYPIHTNDVLIDPEILIPTIPTFPVLGLILMCVYFINRVHCKNELCYIILYYH